jgi:hypothetical protein
MLRFVFVNNALEWSLSNNALECSITLQAAILTMGPLAGLLKSLFCDIRPVAVTAAYSESGAGE